MHVKVDSWGEPIKLGPHEWEFEITKLGSHAVRVSKWRGRIVGVEYWLTAGTSHAIGYTAIVDPEKPWQKKNEST